MEMQRGALEGRETQSAGDGCRFGEMLTKAA